MGKEGRRSAYVAMSEMKVMVNAEEVESMELADVMMVPVRKLLEISDEQEVGSGYSCLANQSTAAFVHTPFPPLPLGAQYTCRIAWPIIMRIRTNGHAAAVQCCEHIVPSK